MKFYTFRLIRDEDDVNHIFEDSIGDKYPLYAITKSKKVANRFMAERNMKSLISIPVDKDDSIADEWYQHNRGHIINKYALETYTHKNTDQQDVKYADILATEDEINFSMESIYSLSIVHRFSDYFDVSIFSSDVLHALETLRYPEMSKFHLSMTLGATVSNTVEYVDDQDCNITDLHVRFDQLGVFVFLHREMLTEAFYANIKIKDISVD